jgi:hypothetical protein
MKQTEYFRRAATDAAFRKAQIEHQRYGISLVKILSWFGLVPLALFSLYWAFTGGGVSALSEPLLTFMIMQAYHMSFTRTLGALEALEDPQPSPASEAIQSASPQR